MLRQCLQAQCLQEANAQPTMIGLSKQQQWLYLVSGSWWLINVDNGSSMILAGFHDRCQHSLSWRLLWLSIFALLFLACTIIIIVYSKSFVIIIHYHYSLFIIIIHHSLLFIHNCLFIVHHYSSSFIIVHHSRHDDPRYGNPTICIWLWLNIASRRVCRSRSQGVCRMVIVIYGGKNGDKRCGGINEM